MKKISAICIVLMFPVITAWSQLSISISDSSNVSCFGLADGTATVIITGGNTPYDIQWDNEKSDTTETADSLSADIWYRVTVTDSLMEVAQDSVMLSQPPEIVYQLEGIQAIECYGPKAGSLEIVSEGGLGPHAYQWTGPSESDSASIDSLTTGTYYFQITDSTGCSVTDSITLEEANMAVISYDTIIQNPCLGQAKAEIHVSVSGGEPPYSYSWTGPGGFTSTLQDITGLKEGQYCLEVSDARTCSYERDTVLADGDPISVSTSTSAYGAYNLLCHGDSSGSISVDTVIGNGAEWKEYTYIWTYPDNSKAYTPAIDGLWAGSYFLNVIDSADCRSDVTIVLRQPPAVKVVFDSIINNACEDDSASAIYVSASMGVEPYAYKWSGPDGFTDTSDVITQLKKGDYTVTVSDSNHCRTTADTTLILTEEILMNLEVSNYAGKQVTCHDAKDGYIKIKSIDGYTDISGFSFLTTGPSGYTSPMRFQYNLGTGTYHLTAFSSAGCSGESEVTLSSFEKPRTGPILGDTIFIIDSNYTYHLLDSSANSTYSWSVEGGEIWSGQGSNTVEIEWRSEDTGMLTAYEIDSNGCHGDTLSLMTSRKAEVIDPTGLADLNAEQVRLYPVPAGDVLNIDGLTLKRGSIEVYSLLGNQVRKTALTGQLDLSELRQGVYHLMIRDVRGRVLLTRKFIKR